MTLLEKIIALHSKTAIVRPGQIVDIDIDIRAARDFGGANVVKNLRDHGLTIHDPSKTMFTLDCNPTGSDQSYAVNQHLCRLYARDNAIKVYDIDAGIGTHLMIDNGYVVPGATAVSTDSHANILGAVGAFGQGMGDMDIAAAWHNGKIWFKVPPSGKIVFTGDIPENVTSKDFILSLLGIFGANSLLGYSIEAEGDCLAKLKLDDRITISSMATEMGAVILLFPPSGEIIEYCRKRSGTSFSPVYADADAKYDKIIGVDVSSFTPMVSRPGEPHDAVPVSQVAGLKVDSVFIGSCTNGRIQDMRLAASILNNRKVAPGVVMKIVPSTDEIWRQCLDEGIIEIFKNAGALVSNAGCAGCAAGQVGQNGPGEVTVSTGNRNFPGKQGKGNVYLASPATAAASAVAGHITSAYNIPDIPTVFRTPAKSPGEPSKDILPEKKENRPSELEGKVWIIKKDNIDTDMIFHNRYLTITDISKMGQYTFDNLNGHEDFARKASKGDIVIAGKNFGSGSSRQQAVDCFLSLGIQGIVAESFGVIYERNAINAGLPVITCKSLDELDLEEGDVLKIDLLSGVLVNARNNKTVRSEPVSEVQYDIYQRGNLLK